MSNNKDKIDSIITMSKKQLDTDLTDLSLSVNNVNTKNKSRFFDLEKLKKKCKRKSGLYI